MKIEKIVKQIQTDLKASSDEKTRLGSFRYFKEAAIFYGVPHSEMKPINSKYWQIIKDLSKGEVYSLFEQLLASNYCEEAFLVSAWLPKLAKQFEKDDIFIFKKWIDKYLNNWAKIDSFCNHSVADHLAKFPDDITEIMSWVKSSNRWMQRAAAVSLILPARRGGYLKEAFQIANDLITSRDDMVQKGYGWLLKEASRQHQKEVFDYVVKNKAIMPRTALRYAIEKMPEEIRIEAMSK